MSKLVAQNKFIRYLKYSLTFNVNQIKENLQKVFFIEEY